MHSTNVDYTTNTGERRSSLSDPRKRRRVLAYFAAGATLVAIVFLWMTWPEPTLGYDYIIRYGNLRVNGFDQTPLLQRQKPIIRELFVNGYIGEVSPRHDGTTFSRPDWQFVIGKDTPETLRAAGWEVDDSHGNTCVRRSGAWGRIGIEFDDLLIKHITIEANEKNPGVTISNPHFARGTSVTLPCRTEDIVAAFGKPDEAGGHFRH